MDKEKNVQIVKQVYADIVAKNLPGVFSVLTDDIRWEPPFTPDIPHTKLRVGKDAVKAWIIEMAGEMTMTQVTPQEIYADGDAVIIKGFFEGTANATGKPFKSDWVHLWKLTDGKIHTYQAFWNTSAVANAIKGESVSSN